MDNKEIFERIPFLLREVWWCCEVKGEDRQEVMRRYGISEKTLVSIVTDVSLLMMKHAETKRDIEDFLSGDVTLSAEDAQSHYEQSIFYRG